MRLSMPIDHERSGPGQLPWIGRIGDDLLEIGQTARDDIASDAKTLEWLVGLIVIDVAVWGVIVEYDNQVEVTIGIGASFSATSE